ncbi:MAG: acetate/propionate family kinase [bacterium]|jgi:acetate kinase|nr:acetate/propionate family kinase [bacterium]
MNILVTNVGSTSLKYRLYRFPEETMLAVGRVERIGLSQGIAEWDHQGSKGKSEAEFASHKEAVEFILQRLQETVLPDIAQLDCVAFKTVIAKNRCGCEILDDTVLQAMEDYNFLAPAHNPPYINAIRMFKALLPTTPLIGLFEPAFHLTMPEKARVYPIPKAWRETYAIQRYGFHGASHRYVSERTPQLMGREGKDLKIISCHLGGSSSMTAIAGGKSIDTSMGFSPQGGVFQGTRIGDFDPFAVFYVMKEENLTIDEIVPQLTKESGLAGLSGISADMRDIEAAMDAGNPDARLAFDAFCYGIQKYIGAFYAVMGGLDVLCFAGGIGERSPRVRETVCTGLEHLGICLDSDKNKDCAGTEQSLSQSQSPVVIWVVPTNEELIVARAAYQKIQSTN